jgi:hypothetical protein
MIKIISPKRKGMGIVINNKLFAPKYSFFGSGYVGSASFNWRCRMIAKGDTRLSSNICCDDEVPF